MKPTMVQLRTSKKTSIFHPYTPDEITELISLIDEVRHTLTTSIVSDLFNFVVKADRVQLFIECFYNLLSDKFFETFPQTLDILDGAILPAFRRIINSKSPIAKARHRRNVISRREKVRAMKELAIEIDTDKHSQFGFPQRETQEYLTLLSEIYLENEELRTELTYIRHRITGIACNWTISETRKQLLRQLLDEFANRISFALNRYEILTTKAREKINGIDERICVGIPQPFEEARKHVMSHAKAAVEHLSAKDPNVISAAKELQKGVKDLTNL